jgi:hypothetical protein
MTGLAVPSTRGAGARAAATRSAPVRGGRRAPAGIRPPAVRALPDPLDLTGLIDLTDPADLPVLDRGLDLVASAVQRQRPGVPQAEVTLLVAATAAELAARHPADGYFPVLVHSAVLGRLPA